MNQYDRPGCFQTVNLTVYKRATSRAGRFITKQAHVITNVCFCFKNTFKCNSSQCFCFYLLILFSTKNTNNRNYTEQ